MAKLLLFLIFSPLCCLSQKQGNIWYFGINAGIDFNFSPPAPLQDGQINAFPYGWNEGCSSISDSSGNLLFYTNGMKIWGSNHQVMPNGDNLMGNASSTQSSIIVPQPGSSQFFYVFTTDAQENNFANGLRYSIVDICLNDGLGDVADRKNVKLLDTAAERLVCIRHSNGVDYWIVTHKFNSDAFYSYKLTNNGISDTTISHTGTIDNIGWGQTAVSTDGLKISITSPSAVNGYTLLLDFDPSTGSVSNEQILSFGSRIYGLSFSPDNSKLYCSATGIGEVYQYNLNAGGLTSIIASKNYIVQNNPDGYRQQKLGPDGKIYLSRTGKQYLSAIESPDSLFPVYIDSAIYLGGKYTSFGLPNFITGYSYSNTSFVCLSLNNAKVHEQSPSLIIYPNPFSSATTIHFPHVVQNSTIFIYDCFGQIVNQIQGVQGQSLLIERNDLPKGLYFFKLVQNNKTTDSGKFVIIEEY
ncbi:MAG: T9SS type A sorting domain-containing protein [Bacteroidota bacterium]|nr:T9SS type A sorting domain-containing protein [Bacteroidota bacterium]